MKKRSIDAVLDEVDQARREIMAEHGNDWRKVLEYYRDLDRQNPERVVRVPVPGEPDQPAA